MSLDACIITCTRMHMNEVQCSKMKRNAAKFRPAASIAHSGHGAGASKGKQCRSTIPSFTPSTPVSSDLRLPPGFASSAIWWFFMMLLDVPPYLFASQKERFCSLVSAAFARSNSLISLECSIPLSLSNTVPSLGVVTKRTRALQSTCIKQQKTTRLASPPRNRFQLQSGFFASSLKSLRAARPLSQESWIDTRSHLPLFMPLRSPALRV